MHSVYVLALLLSATTLGVFSAPLPVEEGEIVSYRRPKTPTDKKPRKHPAIVVGSPIESQDGKLQDIIQISHKLPADKYPHQVAAEELVPGQFQPGTFISMKPIRVEASKLQGKDTKVSDEVYAGISAQMAECKAGRCNHVGLPKVKAPAQDPPKLAKSKAPSTEDHPKAALVHPPPERNTKKEPPRKVRKINDGPLKANAEAARDDRRPMKEAPPVDTRPVKLNAEPSRAHLRPVQAAEKPVMPQGQVKKASVPRKEEKEAKPRVPAIQNRPSTNVQRNPVQHAPQQVIPQGASPKAWGGQKSAAHEAAPKPKVGAKPVKPQGQVEKSPAPKKDENKDRRKQDS